MALVMSLVLLTVVRAASGVWPDCNFQCTANDVTVTRAWLGNATGGDLEQCVPGQPNGSAYVWITMYNNAGTSRYAVRILADLYVDDLLIPVDQCTLDRIPKKESRDYCMHSFPWHCGEAVRLENVIVSWQTSPKSCCSGPEECPPGGQCAFSESVTVAAPLVADFLTNSPQCFCTDIDFTDATAGGDAPYTYSWDFGDGVGTSVEQNPSYHYSAPGTYIVTLSVTDVEARHDTQTEEVQVLTDADLQVTKTDSPDPVYAGETLTYTITVANNGPCDAREVVITDALPAVLSGAEYSLDGGATWLSYDGSVPLGTMDSGAAEEVLVRATAGCPAPCPLEIVNTATVTFSGYDPYLMNNAATASTTVGDNVPPTVISWPDDVAVQCLADVPPPDTGNVTASDNCGTVVIVHAGDQDDGQTCPKTIVRTYRATDECGNSANVTQAITVNDTIEPVITCPPEVTVGGQESTDPSNTGYATATDNCDADPDITYSDQAGGAGYEATGRSYYLTDSAGLLHIERILRTWTATDDCGNVAQCSQMITRVGVVATSTPGAPPPVGGIILPTDKSGLAASGGLRAELAAGLGLAALGIVVAAASLAVRHRRRAAQQHSR